MFNNIYYLLKKKKKKIKLVTLSIPQHIINTLIILLKKNFDKKSLMDDVVLDTIEEQHINSENYNHKFIKLNDILQKKTNIFV